MPFDTPSIIKGLILCSFLGVFLIRKRGNNLRLAFYWIVIFLAIGIIYSYQDFFTDAKDRLLSHMIPGYVVTTGQEIRVQKANDGHFYIFAKLNGTRIRFLVDTGATSVVLPRSYAKILGLDPNKLIFNIPSQTANGETNSASVAVTTFEVANLKFHNFPVHISEVEMEGALLGMSFLKRLKAYEFDTNTLKLKY